ncbi:SRPBCC family protein [Georgenia sp. Z1344]|uniref:SRPBCC family protein n=1 Tax=Georgenia sp. Z1344 TaxID=3416706 RepID=UPI003CE6E40F
MSATTQHPETTIQADPALPTITIVREFDHPVSKVFHAYTDRDLFARWIGPRELPTEIEEWDCTTGGKYRYVSRADGEEYRFYGSFHEVRPDERIVQTFTFTGFPNGVSLETGTFEHLGDGRTRLTLHSVVDTMEARDAMLASGMETGVVEGFEKLDDLLEAGAA